MQAGGGGCWKRAHFMHVFIERGWLCLAVNYWATFVLWLIIECVSSLEDGSVVLRQQRVRSRVVAEMMQDLQSPRSISSSCSGRQCIPRRSLGPQIYPSRLRKCTRSLAARRICSLIEMSPDRNSRPSPKPKNAESGSRPIVHLIAILDPMVTLIA
ncbi:hypothetical protein K504DRAFT_68594 [Pleomassaria siparia CBS 279.74]|uniref:Uncharacterized protein n=1 Tax=Pleomassaria siparia CBS 279.74 TaxID=1314801 RepID=A0A6G1K2V9_9PLEO|nr:hypothetical protein K504DRAFT_68594 [Pleomassaria siparia CBS 279.74]